MTVTTPNQQQAVARASQATAVEQQRAIAEVQAAVVVAQQQPRDVQRAEQDMHDSTDRLALAERAFFRFPRGNEQVSGPSIHLAVELARAWGNIQYGINETDRDDAAGRSEMIAWAWDLQTNTRASTSFINPHARDTRRGRRDLTELRDIYENNANAGSRRLREMIFRVVPRWFLDDAIERCQATLERGDGSDLQQRARVLVDTFAARVRVTLPQLEAKIGRPIDTWTAQDVATLTVVGRSLAQGETTVAEEFPDDAAPRTTAAALAAQGQDAPPATPADPPPAPDSPATPEKSPESAPADAAAPSEPDAAPPGDKPADEKPKPRGTRGASTQAQRGQIHALAAKLGLAGDENRQDRLDLISAIATREITTTNDLSKTEASWVIEKWTALAAELPPEPAPDAQPPADAPAPDAGTDRAPATAPPSGSLPDDPAWRDVWGRLIAGAKRRDIVAERVIAGLREFYAPRDYVDLTVGELNAYMTKLALGTVKAPEIDGAAG